MTEEITAKDWTLALFGITGGMVAGLWLYFFQIWLDYHYKFSEYTKSAIDWVFYGETTVVAILFSVPIIALLLSRKFQKVTITRQNGVAHGYRNFVLLCIAVNIILVMIILYLLGSND